MLTPLSPAECTSLFKLLDSEKRIALAVSGGPDSTALMVLCARWSKQSSKNTEILVLTVDHGLRAESQEEATMVATWANCLGLKHQILRWGGKKPKTNIQAAARKARYALLVDACLKADIGILVTAHHLEDQAETFLLRLARGSGVDGLGAMDGVSRHYGIKLVRPFLDVPRSRLKASLEEIDHSWLDDPSNENERFSRIKIRKLQPALDTLGMTSKRLVATARRMRAARQILENAADSLAREAVCMEPAGYCIIQQLQLAKAPNETALRLLARCLMAIGGQYDRPRYARIEALLSAMVNEGNCRRTFWGCRIVQRGDNFWIWREAGRNGLPQINLANRECAVWDHRFRVSFEEGAGQNGDNKLVVRALEEDGWLQVRDKTADLPAALGRTFVSFWQGNELVGVPHLGISNDEFGCHAIFKNDIFG